jgi:hypothetical protein
MLSPERALAAAIIAMSFPGVANLSAARSLHCSVCGMMKREVPATALKTTGNLQPLEAGIDRSLIRYLSEVESLTRKVSIAMAATNGSG